MLNRILDAFSTRLGILLTLGSLLCVCLAAGVYFQLGVRMVEKNRQVFDERQLRNGFVSMSDIQRLSIIVQDAIRAGGMSEDHVAEFVEATDILYVRADNFRRVIRVADGLPSAVAAIAELETIVDLADTAISNDFPDLAQFAETLLRVSEAARQKLVVYLDAMRVMQDQVLLEQSKAVQKQTFVLWGILSALTFVGASALLLLRREVLGRRARDRAEKRVEFLAFFDPLTELPNRVQFQDRLSADLESGAPLAVMFADLDEFKAINDTSGHAAGDAVLKYIAASIGSEASAMGGFAARLGGDEFAVVLPISDDARLRAFCERIMLRAAEPLLFEGETLHAGLSIGVATNRQIGLRKSATIDLMSRVTDFALYASKSAGRNRYTFYDEKLEARFNERRSMIDELPGAINSGGLVVFLQPKVSLPDARVYGFEALVRWQRDGKIVPPGEFIELAEESGLVLEVDGYVLYSGLQAIADWNRTRATDYSISINLSALHFTGQRVVQRVRDAVRDSGIDPAKVTLEITETMELSDWDQVHRIVAEMHGIGCRVSIDDFGTGFSSLAYLRATMADELKIDKSLVDEIVTSDEARFVFDTVLDLAENLQMDVVVEGIETQEQARIVHEMGVARAQGYHFGRPMACEDALLAAGEQNKRVSLRDDFAFRDATV